MAVDLNLMGNGAGSYTEVSRDRFSEEQLKLWCEAKVVSTQYGLQVVCKGYNPDNSRSLYLSRDSRLQEGDMVDLSKGTVITLERWGSKTIGRFLED